MLLRTFLTNKKSCLLKKDSESQNLIALILINKIYHSKSQHVWMKLWLNQEQKSVHVNIFSVLFLSDKEELQRYFQVNTKSYDWSWVNFCTLIIYISYINCTSTNRSCIAYYIIYSFLQILTAQDYLRLRLTKFHVWNFMCEGMAWHVL